MKLNKLTKGQILGIFLIVGTLIVSYFVLSTLAGQMRGDNSSKTEVREPLPIAKKTIKGNEKAIKTW